MPLDLLPMYPVPGEAAFAAKAYAYTVAEYKFAQSVNLAITNIDSAVTAVTSGLGAGLWTAGTYAIGTQKFGVAQGRLWRRTVATASATDPDVDSTGWALQTLPDWQPVFVSGTTHTAVKNTRVVMRNTAASTLTLPAAPAVGDSLKVKFTNGRTDNVIARNGQPICGQADDALIDIPYFGRVLVYVDATWGWDVEK